MEDIDDYIEARISPEPEFLHNLDRMTHLRMVHGRMCSGHLQGRLLKMLTEMIAPRRVLELGTFTGYSTICIAEALRQTTRNGCPPPYVDTVEVFDENEDLLKSIFADSGYDDIIRLHIADAEKFMRNSAEDSYDLIYIDADKRRYPDYLPEAVRILRPGGWIIADNTLWDGHVIEPDRHDPLTRGVRRFNDMVADDPGLEKVILPIRDGITLIRLRE